MTKPPAVTPDLITALADPGFTPGRRHFPALLDLVAAEDEQHGPAADKALRRAGAPALSAALGRAAKAPLEERPPLLRLIGRLIPAAEGTPVIEEAREFLLARLRDEDARTRRMVAVAIGKLGAGAETNADAGAGQRDRTGIEEALLAAAKEEQVPEVRRAMVAALGKVGGREALAAVQGLALDREVEAVRPRAEIMLQRTVAREQASAIAGDVAPERPLRVAVRCRRGLERMLLEELGPLGVEAPEIRRDPPGGHRIELDVRRPLVDLYNARTMLSFALPLTARTVRAGSDVADVVAERLLSRDAGEILRKFTVGPVRYRVAWDAGGKRRALTWKVAQLVQARAPDLVNDPKESTWEVVVYEDGDRVRVELAPNLPDPRFTYRRGDVPAASHPTVAAALARVAGAREDDVVWDPFVGSGLELCERARLGPFRRIVGSDRDLKALEVARENLAAAGVSGAEVVRRDALKSPQLKEAPTLIITNPPMGRRVHRQDDLGDVLEKFVANAARALAVGGRLVWISPFPVRTEAAARRSGLQPTLLSMLDMGGFEAQIQAFEKLEGGPARRDEGPVKPARRDEGQGERVRRGEASGPRVRRDEASGQRVRPDEGQGERVRRGGEGRGAQRAGAHGEERHARADQDRHQQHDEHGAPGRAGRRSLGDEKAAPGRGERGRRGRS